MDNQWIIFYASSHGFGHMTRCLAIIEELLETTDHLIYLASGAFQNSFARVYLARFGDRVTYRDIRTEVGLVNKDNSLQVDIPRLEHELNDFVAGIRPSPRKSTFCAICPSPASSVTSASSASKWGNN